MRPVHFLTCSPITRRGAAWRRLALRTAALLALAAAPAAAAAQTPAPPPPPADGGVFGGGAGMQIAAPADMKMLKPLPAPKPGSQPPSDDPRNIAGVYTAEMTALTVMRNLPLTPEAAAIQTLDRQRMAQGKPTGDLGAICRAEPTFTIGSDLFPGEVVQTPEQIVFLNEEHRTRLDVYMDRDHPAVVTPSYFGDSVGRWEGDTLVIDTIGFNGRARMVSPKARIVTRIRKIDGGRRLEIKSTTTDPVIYTEPVTDTHISIWNPDVQILEFQCEENLEGAKEGLNVDL